MTNPTKGLAITMKLDPAQLKQIWQRKTKDILFCLTADLARSRFFVGSSDFGVQADLDGRMLRKGSRNDAETQSLGRIVFFNWNNQLPIDQSESGLPQRH